jgi:hypothetical protein
MSDLMQPVSMATPCGSGAAVTTRGGVVVAGTVMIAGAVVDTGGRVVVVVAATTGMVTADRGSDVGEFSMADPTRGAEAPPHAAKPITIAEISATEPDLWRRP